VSNKTLAVDDRIYDYMLSVSLREPELFKELRDRTATMVGAQMQIGPEQGQFMAFLLHTMGAKRVLEIGTFSGYSAMVCASALPEDGELITIDVSSEAPMVGKRFWDEAGLGERIEFLHGRADAILPEMLDEGEAGSFDFVFIDADKGGYDAYYEWALALLRPGGIVALDNVFWDGRAADPDNDEPDTLAIKAINAKIHADPRVEISLVPIGDGLTLARKLG